MVRLKKATLTFALLVLLASCAEDPAQTGTAHPGKAIYDESCFSCHTPGLSGAPKLGDEDAWAPRIAQGREVLLRRTIEGIPPAMPARGVCLSGTGQELADAIDCKIEKSQ